MWDNADFETNTCGRTAAALTLKTEIDPNTRRMENLHMQANSKNSKTSEKKSCCYMMTQSYNDFGLWMI